MSNVTNILTERTYDTISGRFQFQVHLPANGFPAILQTCEIFGVYLKSSSHNISIEGRFILHLDNGPTRYCYHMSGTYWYAFARKLWRKNGPTNNFTTNIGCIHTVPPRSSQG